MTDRETLATSAPLETEAPEAAAADPVDTPVAAAEGDTAVAADAGKTPQPEAEPAPYDWKPIAGEDADALKLLGDFKGPADLLAVVKASKADWREEFAGGDEKMLKRMQRFKDKASWLKSYLSMESKMGDKDYVRKLSDAATPEEVAEFRKAMGVPEKSADYKVNLPEGASEPTELDRAITENFLTLAHKEGYTQRQVDAALAAVAAGGQIAKQYTNEAILNARKDAEDTLRAKWPNKDYRANLDLVNRVLTDYKDQIGADFLKTKIEGGGLIGDHVPLIEFLAELGRERYGAGPIINGEPMEAMGVQKELDKYMKMVGTPEYEKPAVQKRVNELFAQQERLASRAH